MNFRFWKMLGLILLACAAVNLRGADLTVFAAASLGDVLTEIGTNFQAQTGIHVEFNFGGSGALEQQIAQGAPVDVFLSADEAKVNRLEKRGLIRTGTRRTFLSNTLVIVERAGYDEPLKSAADLARARSIALGQPDSVPAGIYAREYLQKLGLWQELQPKVIPTENVRAALAAVEAGNADVAIVYKTDALIAPQVKVALEIPASEGPKISYALAVIKSAPHPVAARQFANYVTSAAAQAVFRKYGFAVPAAAP